MSFVFQAIQLAGYVFKIWPIAGALGLSWLLDLPFAYACGVLWLITVALRLTPLGMFGMGEVTVVVVCELFWSLVQAALSYQAWKQFGTSVPQAELLQVGFGLLLAALTFLVGRIKLAELNLNLDTWFHYKMTGERHKTAKSDAEGSARWKTQRELANDPIFNADTSKPRMMLGVRTDETDPVVALEQITGVPQRAATQLLGSVATSGIPGFQTLKPAPLIYWHPTSHVLTCAGAGSYKSTALVMGNLLTWSGSCVVHDCKGELRDFTWLARRELFGHKVVWLDSSAPDGREILTWTTDLLSWIRLDAMMVSNCRTAAKLMVINSASNGGEGKENFFEGKAQAAAAAYMTYRFRRHKLRGGPRPKIRDIARGLLVSKSELQAKFEAIIREVSQEAADYSLAEDDRESADAIQMMLSEYLEGIDPECWFKTMTTLSNCLAWTTDPRMSRLVSGEGPYSFDIEEIFTGKLSIYICFTVSDLTNNPEAPKAVLGAILAAIMEAKTRMMDAGRCLVVADELQRLGRLTVLHRDSLAAGRGAGIILWGVIQGVDGMKEAVSQGTFADWLDNCDIANFFGLGPDTAKFVSEMLGSKTIIQANGASNLGGARISNDQESVSLKGRPLMYSDEAQRLPKHLMITRVRGSEPFLCGKAYWKHRPEFLPHIRDYERFPKPEVIELGKKERGEYRDEVAQTVDYLLAPAANANGDELHTAYRSIEETLVGLHKRRPDLIPVVPQSLLQAANETDAADFDAPMLAVADGGDKVAIAAR